MTVWTLDSRNPEVRAELDRQCRNIAQAPEEDDVMAWLDSIRAWPGDDEPIPRIREDDDRL